MKAISGFLRDTNSQKFCLLRNFLMKVRFKCLTPKALHNKAQGQRRSRATLGNKVYKIIYTPKALHKESV